MSKNSMKLSEDFERLYVEDNEDTKESTACILQRFMKNLKICCVEDDRFALENLVEYLKYFCDTVYSCDDPVYAKKVIEEEKPDIIISDIKMPGINGLELTHWIKINGFKAKIILMSAYFEPELFTEAIELKVDHFLTKPFNKEELTKALTSCANAIALRKQADEYTSSDLQGLCVYTDLTTNLPNHNKLLLDVNESTNPTLIIFELVGFEQIDDIYGTEISDMLLKQIAGFFVVQVPEKQKFYRYQYNQFAILIENFTESKVKDLITTFNNLILLSSFEAYGITVHVTLKFGICMEKSNIIEKAHKALLQTKTKTNLQYCFYNRESKYIQKQRRNIIYGMKIKKAIESFNIFTFFQPILNLKNNKVEKYEALIRMKDERKLLSPTEFIAVNKHIGLPRPLTKQVINQSFQKFKQSEFDVAINLSLDDFETNDIPNFLRQRINDFEINPQKIVLEVTEDISLNAHNDILKTLQHLKAEGFKIAIDDFGTSMANFHNICSIEPEYIKINGVFIKDINTNQKNYKIVKSLVAISQNIGAKTIAEFVHNQAILEIVRDLGVNYAQGYLIGVPSCLIEGERDE